MAGKTFLDIRQSQTRVLQDQLNSTALTPMDSTLASINSEETAPGRLIAQTVPSLVVTVGSGVVANPNTGKNRILPYINNTAVNFTGGSITFPSTSGTITVSAGPGAAITIGANQFVAVLVQLDSSANIQLSVSAAASSIGTVIIPLGNSNYLSLGYIIVQSNGSSIIQNVINSMLYQFYCVSSVNITGVLPYNQGGTGQGSLWNADGIIYAASTSVLASTTVGTAGQILTSNGPGNPPTMQSIAGNTAILKAPTVQIFTSPIYSTFTVSSANATAGATYTNNGFTFTVLNTISAGTTLYTDNAGGVPTSSGTLTKSSGTGNATITFSAVSNVGLYTTPANVLYLKIKMVGGGGGGGGSGTSTTGGNGGAGGNTTFGSILTAGGGGGGFGGDSGAGGTGGTATVATSATVLQLFAANGASGHEAVFASGTLLAGGSGANSIFGGAAAGIANHVGTNAASNSGSGGSGGGTNSNSTNPGSGGGAGAGLEAIITQPNATYNFAVAIGGAGGSQGTSGLPGGNGGSGQIIVEEHYQ